MSSQATIDLDGQQHQLRGAGQRFVDTLSADVRAQVNPLASAIENSRPTPSAPRRIRATLARVFSSVPMSQGLMSPTDMAEFQAGRDAELDQALMGQ